MRYYFEVQSEDRYTGFITMLSGETMEYKHLNHNSEAAYLQDIRTGECYPIVRILCDDEGDLFVTEV